MSTKSETKKITKSDLLTLFWRAFLLPACYSNPHKNSQKTYIEI